MTDLTTPAASEPSPGAADLLIGRYLRTTGLQTLDTQLAKLWGAEAIRPSVLLLADTADTLPPDVARLVEKLVSETDRLFELLADVEAVYMEIETMVAVAPLLANGLPEPAL